jgi:hypothetical protein
VPLLENIGKDLNRFARDALDGIETSFDLRPEILDDDGFEHGNCLHEI